MRWSSGEAVSFAEYSNGDNHIDGSVWIGATDVINENDFGWVNGFDVGYNRFTSASANWTSSHFVSMTFRVVESGGVYRRAVVEHDCE